VAPLFAGQPGVAEIVPYPRGRERWRLLWGLRKQFDLALALPNSLESALGLWLTATPVRVGYNADARRIFLNRAVAGRHRLAGLHTVYYLLGLLGSLGEVETFTYPHIVLQPAEKAAAAMLLDGGRDARPTSTSMGPWVGLSPGAAYGPAKRWPPERFAALGTALQREFGARLVLLGGSEDREAAAQVMQHLTSPALDLVGRTTLRQALGVLTHLQLLVTNDSGLMHAAAALNAPLIALFGSTDPEATGPFSPRATVLRHPQHCAPCFQRTCATGYQCLTAISVAEVLAAARPWLENPT
jgi:heptosyltransferase-2